MTERKNHPFVVYRRENAGAPEYPVALASATSEQEAVDLVQPKWPARSKLTLRGGQATGEWRAESAYSAPLEHVQRVCVLSSTELLANTCNNTAVLAQSVGTLMGMAQLGGGRPNGLA